jgi:uncharacterized protein (TIGR02594 family)
MRYRAKTTTLVRAEPSEHAQDTGSIEKNIEFEGTAGPQGAWIHVERPFSGWVSRGDCEEVGTAREPIERDGFVQRCVIAEWTFNAADGIAPWLVVAEYLIARALIETGIDNASPAAHSDGVGPLRVTSTEWGDFLREGGALAAGCAPADRQHPIRQVDGAAFRMHRDAKRLSELGIAVGKATAADPYIPTPVEVLLAYLTDSPEAALALAAADPNLPIDQVLCPPLVSADLIEAREHFFRAGGAPRSVRAAMAGVRGALDAALAQAAREIETYMPEAAPLATKDSLAPWFDVADAAKSAGVDERDPRFRSTILGYFDATDFSPKPTSVTTPWCGAFAAHCMKTSGNPTAAASVPKGAAAAASWKAWGTALPWPARNIPEGAVVVLSPNHIGFFCGFDGDRVVLIGGNQSDRVDRTPFAKAQVVAARWLNLGPAPVAGAAETVGTLSREQYARYLGTLGEMESGNNYGTVNRLGYCGRWQFGAGALADAGYVRAGTTNRALLSPAAWTGKDGVSSRADWLARPDAQDAAMLTYTPRALQKPARPRRADTYLLARAYRRPAGGGPPDGHRRRAPARCRHHRARCQRHHHAQVLRAPVRRAGRLGTAGGVSCVGRNNPGLDPIGANFSIGKSRML